MDVKVTDLRNNISKETEFKARMTNEILRFERVVQSREDYIISLENESIMLRKEIKDCKFGNEKQGYAGFVGSLTQLRQTRNGGIGDGGSVSAERKRVTISNRNSSIRKSPIRREVIDKENNPDL